VVKHPIDRDSSEGDVEPKGESEAGDLDVALKLAFEGPPQAKEYKGKDGHGENRMRNENRKINGADPANAWKGSGAVEIMVSEVRNEKEG